MKRQNQRKVMIVSRTARSSQGFALVMALSLMAFVLLLLLSMSALLRVEIMNSSQQQQYLLARQNALVGLYEAVGELQQAAGPDQRVTATGALRANPPAGTEHLVAVWDASDQDNDGVADGSFVRWLVSSLETADTSNADFINAVMPITYDGSQYLATNSDYALLVGSGSVAPNPSDLLRMPAVVAALKPITSGGRYAWWVGDEGVKARVDALDPYAFDLNASGEGLTDFQRNALSGQSMQGTGIAAVSGFGDIDLILTPKLALDLSRLSSLAQLELLDFTSAEMPKSELLKSHFHDFSAYSQGIQTNVREGGLKTDLSLLFEQTANDFDDSNSNFMESLASRGLTYSEAPGAKATLPLIFVEPLAGVGDGVIYGPTVDLLRDYYRLYKGVASSGSAAPVLPRSWLHTYGPGKSWFLNAGLAGSEQEAWIQSLGMHAWRNVGAKQSTDSNRSYERVKVNEFEEGRSLTSLPAVRATQGAYLPYLSRFTVIYSTVSIPNGSGYDLDVVVQPFIAMHNPYNVSVSAPRMRFLQDLDRFEIIARRDDGNEWAADRPFRTGDPGASNDKFLGNVYSSLAGSAGQQLENSALSVLSSDDAPQVFGKSGKELTYNLAETQYAPGEVKLFTAASVAAFNTREVELEEFGGDYLPSHGIYLGLPNIALYVDHDGDLLTERQQLLQGVPATDDIMLQIVMDNWVTMAYEIYDTVAGHFNAAGSYFHAKNGMAGGGELLQTLPQLQLEIESDYISLIDYADSYGASPVAHLVVDHFIKPVDYNEILGQANSLTAQQRTFPNFIMSNPLAASFSHTGMLRREAAGLGDLMHTAGFRVSSASGGIPMQDLFDNDHASWGSNNGRFGEQHSVILEIPSAPLQSIGQLQHASLNPSPYYPALSVGHSFRSPYLSKAALTSESVNDNTNVGGQEFVWYDQNYLLNEAIWDSYFFSSIAPRPTDGSYSAVSPASAMDPFLSDIPAVIDGFMEGRSTLGNSRMSFLQGESSLAEARAALIDPMQAAGHLSVKGAFNVNSTSVDAWAAFLAGYRQVAIQYYDANQATYGQDTDMPGAAFLRHSMPAGPAVASDTDLNDSAAWAGFLRLTDEELEALAESIVAEIMARAAARGSAATPVPALSLADFVNRTPGQAGFEEAGTLQAAIDRTPINSTRYSNDTEFSTAVYNANDSDYPDSQFTLNSGATAPISLTQADILQAIGPAISARSDTFRIRAYGESSNPSGDIIRVWCEAVYQRGTDFVDPSDYNRGFKQVSFRWLNPDEV
tara:strand:+ start:127 stop:3924 length:3798 start_codon:yes stop_codon:yes gene_type:complete